jgi:hypothetical protein
MYVGLGKGGLLLYPSVGTLLMGPVAAHARGRLARTWRTLSNHGPGFCANVSILPGLQTLAPAALSVWTRLGKRWARR